MRYNTDIATSGSRATRLHMNIRLQGTSRVVTHYSHCHAEFATIGFDTATLWLHITPISEHALNAPASIAGMHQYTLLANLCHISPSRSPEVVYN